MSALYNHAISWELIDRIQSRAQSAYRASVKVRNARALHFCWRSRNSNACRRSFVCARDFWCGLDMTMGLRRGELAGLRSEDIRFEDLTVMARRSVVDQAVGNVKTEASQRPIPIDPFIAEDLLPGIEVQPT
jgi:integrase